MLYKYRTNKIKINQSIRWFATTTTTTTTATTTATTITDNNNKNNNNSNDIFSLRIQVTIFPNFVTTFAQLPFSSRSMILPRIVFG